MQVLPLTTIIPGGSATRRGLLTGATGHKAANQWKNSTGRAVPVQSKCPILIDKKISAFSHTTRKGGFFIQAFYRLHTIELLLLHPHTHIYAAPEKL